MGDAPTIAYFMVRSKSSEAFEEEVNESVHSKYSAANTLLVCIVFFY